MKKILKFLLKRILLFITLPIWLPIACYSDNFCFWLHDKGWFD